MSLSELRLLSILTAERKATLEMMALRAQDSRLGFEASNHYYYGQRELMEKLLNLSQVSEQLKAKAPQEG